MTLPQSIRNVGTYFDYLGALIFAYKPRNATKNTNEPTRGLIDVDARLVIEEGRRQITSQEARFASIIARAQHVMTVGIAVVAYAASTFASVKLADDPWATWPWRIGMVLAILSLGGAGAVAVVRADFGTVDATRTSGLKSPIVTELADAYASAVRIGEEELATRVLVFRVSTRLLVFGALAIALARVRL